MLSAVFILGMTAWITAARTTAATPAAHFLTYISYQGGFASVVRADDAGAEQTVIATDRSFVGSVLWMPDRMAFALAKSAIYQPPNYKLYNWTGDRQASVELGRVASYAAQLNFSPDGSRVLMVPAASRGVALDEFAQQSGQPQWLSFQPVTSAAWSPDGSWIAYSVFRVQDGGQSLHLMRADGTDKRLLVDNVRQDVATPQWSPDGSRILFRREVLSETGLSHNILFDVRPDGTDERALTPPDSNAYMPRYSPDGTKIVYHDFDSRKRKSSVAVVPADGGEPMRMADDFANISALTWTPDGESLVFVGNPIGQPSDVYAVGLQDRTLRQITSDTASEGGLSWSADYARDWQPLLALAVGLFLIVPLRLRAKSQSTGAAYMPSQEVITNTT